MKKVFIGLVFALVAALLAAPSLYAGSDYTQGGYKLKLIVAGPVSCARGQTLTLEMEVVNENSFAVPCTSVMIVVVDPWTGVAVAGPITTGVNKTIPAYESIVIPAVSVSIPKTVTANTTLAVVIFAVEKLSPDLPLFLGGSAGWGFVAQ
jgi:NAD(P)H-hydrate repair Nnr-like enzyme with NAD(P)H-hydrate epimerase domain